MAKALAAAHVFAHYFYSYDVGWGLSMMPTMGMEASHLLVSKRHRLGRGVEPGDIIVLRHLASPGSRIIKRVVGMPGDYVLVGPHPVWGGDIADEGSVAPSFAGPGDALSGRAAETASEVSLSDSFILPLFY